MPTRSYALLVGVRDLKRNSEDTRTQALCSNFLVRYKAMLPSLQVTSQVLYNTTMRPLRGTQRTPRSTAIELHATPN